MTREIHDDILPQHDLDERNRLGRQTGLENAHRSQWEVAQKGRDELGPTGLLQMTRLRLEWDNLHRALVAGSSFISMTAQTKESQDVASKLAYFGRSVGEMLGG